MAEKLETGRIVRSLSGFYDVVLPDGTLTCKARGILRKQGQSPLTGDMAVVTRQGEKGMVEQILLRKNSFVRPAVANVDALVIFAANVNPVTEPFLIDRVSAIAGNKGVACILCVNKTDLDQADSLRRIYSHAGFPVIATSAETEAGVEQLRQAGEFTNLKGLIYFTDGFGTFPERQPDYHTAFVFIDDEYNNPDVPVWAIKLVLQKDEI